MSRFRLNPRTSAEEKEYFAVNDKDAPATLINRLIAHCTLFFNSHGITVVTQQRGFKEFQESYKKEEHNSASIFFWDENQSLIYFFSHHYACLVIYRIKRIVPTYEIGQLVRETQLTPFSHFYIFDLAEKARDDMA